MRKISIFSQLRWKEKIENVDGFLEYRQRLDFIFNETKSHPFKDIDPINILNVPFNVNFN